MAGTRELRAGWREGSSASGSARGAIGGKDLQAEDPETETGVAEARDRKIALLEKLAGGEDERRSASGRGQSWQGLRSHGAGDGFDSNRRGDPGEGWEAAHLLQAQADTLAVEMVSHGERTD